MDEPAAIDGTHVVLEQHPGASWTAKAMLVAGPLLFLGFLLHFFRPGILGLHILVAGLVARWSQTRQNFWARRAERRVKFTREGVFVDDVLVVPRAKIASGHFQPRPPRDPRKKRSYASSMRLLDARGRLLFESEVAEPQALDILRLLGLDPSSRRADFAGSSPLYATPGRSMMFSLGMIAVGIGLTSFTAGLGLSSPVLLYLMASLMFAGMWPSRIAVGVDGVLLRWLWQKRFIPMSEIANVEPRGDREIQITLASGAVETVWTSMARRHGRWNPQRRDAVLARIDEARRAHQAGGPTADVSALVGRGSRSPHEWIEALKKLRQVDAGYRRSAVRDEDLWRVVEDPAAPEDARAGAAMALRGALDDEAKTRVRVAAEATASPKLRVALDAAIGESDSAMAAALEEIGGESEEPGARAAS